MSSIAGESFYFVIDFLLLLQKLIKLVSYLFFTFELRFYSKIITNNGTSKEISL